MAGFQISATLAEWPLFLQGAVVTLLVSLLGGLFGIVFGVGLTVMRAAPWAPLRWLAKTYMSFIRGTPILVQIFLVYYGLPGLTGIDLPPLVAGVLALSLNSAAFITEIIRAGLSAVPAGQYEAAKALAVPRGIMWMRVILPQVLRLTIPPLMNEFTMLVKASPLLSVITVVELTRTAQNVMNFTYQPIQAFALAAVLYFVMLFSLSMLTRRVDARMRAVRA
ncbi:amino acid ABC transporter permease [Rhodoligotrophos defluvii]|uniref:amino acid ABC transporter permease n=1 Tax=Rhodoligotrophos defluvii TaxID=2561934 RepID=UPI0010C9682A|nr:amino acid ABC transporter permease [Rhodoligotrophos defluvii]